MYIMEYFNIDPSLLNTKEYVNIFMVKIYNQIEHDKFYMSMNGSILNFDKSS